MEDGVTWQLLLNAPPRRVFCVLVRIATEQRTLCNIEDFGMGLAIYARRGRAESRLTVRLHEHDGRTLLQISPCGPYVQRDTVAEAEAIGAMFHDLRGYLDPARPRGLATLAHTM